jgi:hypothetical protein
LFQHGLDLICCPFASLNAPLLNSSPLTTRLTLCLLVLTCIQRSKKPAKETSVIGELSEASLIIKQGDKIARRDKRPLDPDSAIVRYTGTGGSIIDFVVSMG